MTEEGRSDAPQKKSPRWGWKRVKKAVVKIWQVTAVLRFVEQLLHEVNDASWTVSQLASVAVRALLDMLF